MIIEEYIDENLLYFHHCLFSLENFALPYDIDFERERLLRKIEKRLKMDVGYSKDISDIKYKRIITFEND